MRLKLFLILIVFLAFSSCDRISTYSDQFLSAVGFGDKTTKKKSTTSRKKNKKDTPTDQVEEKAKDEPESGEEDSQGVEGELQLVVKRQDQSQPQKLEKKKIKSAQAPTFKVDAPVNVLKRFGGSARFIAADSSYIYLDFPQHFALFDASLGEVARVRVSYPVLAVRRIVLPERTLFYLKEENDVFEILELTTPEQSAPLLKVLQNIEMEGPFQWLDDSHLAVTTGSEVQILDISKASAEDVHIEAHFPLTGHGSILKVGEYLYVARESYLDILSSKDYSLQSSLHVGRDYGFLGVVIDGEQGEKKLVLSLKGQANELKGIQYLEISADASSIMTFGETILFDEALTGVSLDLDEGWILGLASPKKEDQSDGVSEAKTSDRLKLFSLKEKRFLRGMLDDTAQTHWLAWSVFGDQIYLVSPSEITVNRIQLAPTILNKNKIVQSLPQQGSSPLLAQTQPLKRVQDEYQLTQVKKLEFASDSRVVELLDRDHMILLEKAQDQKSHRLLAVVGLTQDNFQMKEIALKEPVFFDRSLVTDFGLILYSVDKSKFYLVDVNFDKLTELGIPPQKNVSSLLWFSRPAGEILVIASELKSMAPVPQTLVKTKVDKKDISSDVASGDAKNKVQGNKKSVDSAASGKFAMRIYLLTSPQDVQLLSEKNYAEKPFVFKTESDQLVVTTGSFVEKMDISDLKKPEVEEDSRITLDTAYNFIDMKISPNQDQLFGLYSEGDINKILAMSVRDPNKNTKMENLNIQPTDFRGMVFGRQGQVLILPSQDGTLFFDLSQLPTVKESARWSLSSHHVAVADGGAILCIALGPKGVYCGEPLF